MKSASLQSPGHEHEHTPKEQRQRRVPALSPTPTSRLPTLRHSVPVDLMLDQALHICMFNNSTSHQSFPYPPSIQLNSPPTAYNSRLYQALLVAVCLSPDLDHAPLCYCSRLLRAEREHHRWLKLESSSRIPLRSVTRLRELPIACMNHEYVSPSTHRVGALRNAIFSLPSSRGRINQHEQNPMRASTSTDMNQSTRPKDSTIPPYSAKIRLPRFSSPGLIPVFTVFCILLLTTLPRPIYRLRPTNPF